MILIYKEGITHKLGSSKYTDTTKTTTINMIMPIISPVSGILSPCRGALLLLNVLYIIELSAAAVFMACWAASVAMSWGGGSAWWWC